MHTCETAPPITIPRMTAPVAVPQLVLASRSPRRAALLREAGIAFTVTDPPFDDPADPMMNGDHPSPADLACALALRKAHSLIGHVEHRSIILAADTIVVLPRGEDYTLLGQPATLDEAQRMLLQLMNVVHDVVTGVALLAGDGQRREMFADVAHVHIGTLDPGVLRRYLDSGAWRGKAGGYNLLELPDWPINVQGDRTTVAGLPMARLRPRLAAWGVSA